MSEIFWDIVKIVAGFAALMGLRIASMKSSKYNPPELGKDFISILREKEKPKKPN